MSSNNKYGLDFRVWGHEKTEKKKDTTPDILKSIGHGWGESSKPKKQQNEVEYTEERIVPKKEQITCVLKNARFLPDENTDFKKPCKIRVEIEGKSNRIVHFYLWAIYEGVEYDLQYEVEASKKNGICETEMKLFYVGPYHNDVFKNGKKDAKVEYFAKVKMQGAKEIRSELLVMPRPPAVLNINEIDGPDSLAHNTKGVYVVESFNRKASQEEKDSLSWAVKVNGKEIERFENVGDSFEYTPSAKYAGETITVHPFLRSPSDKLFIKTTIGQYLLYNSSELIWIDESNKEIAKWKAYGNTDTTDPAKENGPIPEGNWVILQDAKDQTPENSWWKDLTGKKDPVIWADKNKVELIPFKETDTQGRVEKFYLAGSEDNNNSLRGINLAENISDFVERFQKSGKNLVLKIYINSRSDNFNFNDYGFPEIITGEIELVAAQKIALKITEEYEGGQGAKTLIGNFDGQGISWGIMQWNFGQGTLGPLLNKMMIKNQTIFRNVFGNNKKDFEIFLKVITNYNIREQIEWAKIIQNDKFQIIAKWKQYFDSFANIEIFIELQEDEAIKDNHTKTLSKLNWLRQKHPKLMGKITLRTYVSLFDLSNQQGSIDSKTIKHLEDQWVKNPPLTQFEIIRDVVYNRGLSASGSGGKYRADCISRRMGILYASPYKVNKNINKGIICDSLRTNSCFNLLKMNKIVKGI